MSKHADDEYLEAIMRLRHASFALAGSANSLDVADRTMAEAHLVRTALAFGKAHENKHRQAGLDDEDKG